MADWVTIYSLATGGGTLALAAATFGSVRSANRAARTAERALQVGLRAVLVPSRPEAPAEKIMWVDRHWARVGGGQAVVESVSGVVYLALAVRNVGPGLAVIHGWHVRPGLPTNEIPPAEPGAFRRQTRDLYIPSGDSGFWQGAVRDAEDPYRAIVERAVAAREAFTSRCSTATTRAASERSRDSPSSRAKTTAGSERQAGTGASTDTTHADAESRFTCVGRVRDDPTRRSD